ncbi:MAG TPA: glycoside hydrolase family 2 TIM barrel-domain containing protein [Streptosporangiaceae bacterium]
MSVSRRSFLIGGVLGAAAAALGTSLALLARQHSGAGRPQAAGLRPVREARSYDFGQRWLFGGRYVTGAEQPGYDDGGFENVTLPHTVTSLSWDNWDYASWEDVWIYRKHFAGAAVTGARVLVTFDGVMTNAIVVLNGWTAGAHAGGYLPWTTELTSYMTEGDNVLAVIVDTRWLDVPPDAEPSGPSSMDYLQPGGIYRDVRLQVVPQIYLEDVFARPENVLSSDRDVKVQATVNAAVVPEGNTATITATLLDGTRVLAAARTADQITGTGTSTVSLTIGEIGPVTYWSPENPKLYTVKTTLCYGLPGGQGGHTVTTAIGFREAVFTEGGFYLNGDRYKIFGLNRHQMFPCLGMAAAARLQRRDAQILKNELNCNMVRCSHYPQSPHFLDACDELGIMVWEEPPGWGHMGDAAFQARLLRDVRDMVVRDRNRPSVVVWGARLNETGNYPVLYAQARRIAYACDGSRQTTGALVFHTMAGWAEDVFSYDDYHMVDGEPELLPPVPGVPYLISESVGALNPTYRWFDPPSVLANQAFAHALAHDQAQSDIRYAGVLAWAGLDYYAAGRNSRNWNTLRTPGVIDTFRVPKPGTAIYQSQVDPATRAVIVPVFFWDSRSAPAGPGPDSMFTTNCDRLEIFAGGKHLATATPDRRRFGHLAYPPAFAHLTVDGGTLPDLRVDGYVGTMLAAVLLMSADTSRDRLRLTVDDTTITADGSDTTRVTFRATDAYGNHRPNMTGEVTLSLTGPAALIGQNPFAFGSYGGVGGAFVRSVPGKTGQVTVTARHATLGSASVQVTLATARPGRYL